MTLNDNGEFKKRTRDQIDQAGETFCRKQMPENFNKNAIFNPILADFENGMKDSLLGKVMENFENTMIKETMKLDEMKREEDRKQFLIEKDRNSQHIPLLLRNEGMDPGELWLKIHNLIVAHNPEDESMGKIDWQVPSPEVTMMLLSHSIGAWLSTLSSGHYQKVARQIYSETSHWISKIWRFRCSASYFHKRLYDGTVSVCKLALATQFPKYQTEGYTALYSHPPVIYLNCGVDSSLIEYLKSNMGLPSDCISLVPNNFQLNSDESMDIVSLELLILADIKMGKLPLVICIYAGSPNTDSMDKLTDIQQLCKNHRIWLHVEGSRLSELALLHVPAKINTISSKVKSMTLDLGKWLGIASVPYVTLVVTNISESYLHTLGYGAGHFSHNRTALEIFPLWISLQLIGHDGIINKIENQIRQNHSIVRRLQDISNIRLIFRGNEEMKKSTNHDASTVSTENGNGVGGVMDNVLTFMLDGHQIPFIIVFHYEPPLDAYRTNYNGDVTTGIINGVSRVLASDYSSQDSISATTSEDNETQSYINSLNQWLADNLLAMYPQMNISVINLPAHGISIRLCLQDNIIGQDITENLLEKFAESVTMYSTIMDATARKRILFHNIVKTKREIVHLSLPKWAGLGCLIFIPEMYRTTLFNSTVDKSGDFIFNFKEFFNVLSVPKHLNHFNKINKKLVDELRNSDEAFSLGIFPFSISSSLKDPTNDQPPCLICTRFGLISETTSVENLIELVVTKGMEVETSNRNLDKLSILVRQGIEEVNDQLAKEQENRIQGEGVLRQLPYIDSIVNWMYPPDKNHIKGRSLNLSSGTINCTDDTYKYKMQLQTPIRSADSSDKETIDQSTTNP